MKVIAINGSARKDGNCAILVRHAFEPLQIAGIKTEMMQLAGEKIRGCTACYQCWQRKDGRCAIRDDIVNDCIEQMQLSQGVLLASPTYFADITAEMKALIDRAGMVSRANGHMLRRKAGAAIVSVRRGGAMHAFHSINGFFLISQRVVPGSTYWNMGIGREIGDVEQDGEGLETMRVLGENMAWLLRQTHGS